MTDKGLGNFSMKSFVVQFKNKTEKKINAESYHREGEQYLFDGTPSGEVEFALVDLVASITVEPPPRGPSTVRVSF